MSRWVPVPVPDAPLESVDREEIREDDGRLTRVFQSKNGVRFVRISEESGFTYWLQEVK